MVIFCPACGQEIHETAVSTVSSTTRRRVTLRFAFRFGPDHVANLSRASTPSRCERTRGRERKGHASCPPCPLVAYRICRAARIRNRIIATSMVISIFIECHSALRKISRVSRSGEEFPLRGARIPLCQNIPLVKRRCHLERHTCLPLVG